MLREVHEGICGNHIGARALAGKVLRQGYYRSTILRDATDLVKKCRICQEHAKISRLPSEPLTSITSPWPFQQWGLDILGPLLIGKGQCKFIIVAVDYFTKWAEVEFSHNYRAEDTQFCVESHHMQVWYSKSPGIRQRKTIRQHQIQRFLCRARN